METVSIMPSENAVYVNGEFRLVDCSSVDKSIHAVQWCYCQERKKGKGHIEWVQDPLGERKRNTPIDNIEQFKELVDAFHKMPTEKVRHRRVRADNMVMRAEMVLTDIEKMPESTADEVQTKRLKKTKMEAQLAERKKQRDDVYAGRLDQVNKSGAL